MSANGTTVDTATQASFKASRHMLSVAEAMMTGCVVIDTDAKISYINKFTQEVLENIKPGSVSDLLGSHFEGYTVEENVWDLVQDHESLPVQVTVRVGELEAPGLVNACRTKDGTVVGYVYTWTPLASSSAAATDAMENAKAVVKVLEAVADAEDLTAALTVTLETVREAFGYDYGSYWRRDRERDTLVFAAQSGTVNDEFERVTQSASFDKGIGLAGRVWEAGELIFESDLGTVTDCVRAPAARDAGVKSGFAIPVTVAGDLVGTLDFFKLEEFQLTEDRRTALKSIARAVSGAVERAQHAEEVREAAENAEAVSAVLSALANSRTAGEAIQAALDTVREAFDWDYGSWWRRDMEADTLRFNRESGTVTDEFRDVTQSASFDKGVGLAGRVWQQNQLIFEQDLGTVTDCVRAPAARNAGVKSGVAFPVVVEGELVGTMDFFATRTLSLSDDRMAALRSVGQSVSEAIAKARRLTENARVTSMMENAPTNMMFADKDLVLRYMNPKSEETLRSIEEHLPVKVDDIIGQTIDIFHKNPAHQRGILGNPEEHLPMRSNIQVGPETLDLLVSAIRDGDGNYIGAMASWEVITEKLAAEKREEERVEREREAAEELRAKVDAMLAVVEAAATGDLTQEVTVSGEDAIGQMGEGLARLLGDLRESIGGIVNNAAALAGASEALEGVSQTMGQNAAETSTQIAHVSEGSEQVSSNVEAVASAAEEMSASIKEISQNTAHAAQVAGQAVDAANTTNQTISKLGDSSAEIGKIIKVITGIAQQTNLLALNATIEAARAGEAGKGFAVVANEVKELAKETAKATEDISQKIEAIQTDTGSAVEAIDEISTIINQISDIQTTIASAVEEQAATTSEIARSVNEANRRSAEITDNVSQVAQAAAETSEGAQETQRSAVELRAMSDELRQLVDQFTI